ncbi:DUF5825 family protein [Actinomadura rubrisoli]|uniref:Uncharacterized protein n=1 Tax=Actinomadura rubrisoli TaxID=2530368 RepID=A0A4R5BMS2_9ACTN|nr:DUF5825 family protein [Actinomadura rubrisoli]TDD87139.1 hypothetical protein E1298_16490 [Actinomadura rubrisoli]
MTSTAPPGAETVMSDWVRLGAEPAQTLSFLAWLRDRLSQGTIVRWRGTVAPSLAGHALYHLPPPGDGEETADWRSRFRLGLCYYRRGPGFIQIKDVRDPGDSATFLLDEPVLVQTFTRCLAPRSLAGAEPAEREAIEALVDARLLLRLDDLVMTLPSHMTRWPVPALAI